MPHCGNDTKFDFGLRRAGRGKFELISMNGGYLLVDSNGALIFSIPPVGGTKGRSILKLKQQNANRPGQCV